jgi:hypothetical protein
MVAVCSAVWEGGRAGGQTCRRGTTHTSSTSMKRSVLLLLLLLSCTCPSTCSMSLSATAIKATGRPAAACAPSGCGSRASCCGQVSHFADAFARTAGHADLQAAGRGQGEGRGGQGGHESNNLAARVTATKATGLRERRELRLHYLGRKAGVGVGRQQLEGVAHALRGRNYRCRHCNGDGIEAGGSGGAKKRRRYAQRSLEQAVAPPPFDTFPLPRVFFQLRGVPCNGATSNNTQMQYQ